MYLDVVISKEERVIVTPGGTLVASIAGIAADTVATKIPRTVAWRIVAGSTLNSFTVTEK